MADDDDIPLPPPRVPAARAPAAPKPPPIPARAREIPATRDLPKLELDASDRRRPRAITSAPRVPHAAPPATSPPGAIWVRIAIILVVLAGVSVGAYMWNGR